LRRLDRRQALALGAATALAACGRQPTTPRARPIDKARLAQGFPALAARAAPGGFALGVLSLADASQAWYSDDARAFPLSGAVAVPIAAAVLGLVDQGQASLDRRVDFGSLDLSPPFSLIDERWPEPPQDREATILLSGLATLALRQGDNTAIDLSLRPRMTFGTIGAHYKKLLIREGNGIRVQAAMRQFYRGSNGNEVIVPHQLADAIRSKVGYRSQIALELNCPGVATRSAIAARLQHVHHG